MVWIISSKIIIYSLDTYWQLSKPGSLSQELTLLTQSQTTFVARPRWSHQNITISDQSGVIKSTKYNKIPDHMPFGISDGIWPKNQKYFQKYQVVFGDVDDHGEKGGLNKLGQVI